MTSTNTSPKPPRTPGRTRLSASARRAEIASAAHAVALGEGLFAVTMRAVAAEAGVAPALVAHYVPSMDELVASTFAAIVGEELGELRERAAARSDAREAIADLLDTLLDGTRDDVTLVWVQGWGLGGRNDALAEAVRAATDEWVEFLAGIIETGIAAGLFIADDAAAVAMQLVGMVDGLNAQALVRWRDAEGRRALMSVATEAMLGMPRGSLLGSVRPA